VPKEPILRGPMDALDSGTKPVEKNVRKTENSGCHTYTPKSLGEK